ncbi:uncharacterized protein THITE_159927 [Thermothielavioides terrestris NRRL 8126]|uniref:Uncharacterized protein n=1 Tax=Thermothielavioides terrestris (strain ATCC 38088 / NRRL 8126) TaxID=578455 RepID=G2R611_THETT|nr:uncharacterized protein THITE_159927 [Thermothielavioides terrestris NRRL 8126]AEO68398.1 hypothetical protein THITE_159927 [Thermothielavioides terrestris NRRL 8126]
MPSSTDPRLERLFARRMATHRPRAAPLVSTGLSTAGEQGGTNPANGSFGGSYCGWVQLQLQHSQDGGGQAA